MHSEALHFSTCTSRFPEAKGLALKTPTSTSTLIGLSQHQFFEHQGDDTRFIREDERKRQIGPDDPQQFGAAASFGAPLDVSHSDAYQSIRRRSLLFTCMHACMRACVRTCAYAIDITCMSFSDTCVCARISCVRPLARVRVYFSRMRVARWCA